MKLIPLYLLLAVVFACIHIAGAQAGVEAVQLNRQAVDSTSGSKKPLIPGKGVQPSPEEAPRDVQPYDALNRIPPNCNCAKEPFFSVNSSVVELGTEVTIASPTPDAVIYYTTDGWTPTNASERYTGPIPINENTHLQAVAEEPQKSLSMVVDAIYTVSMATDTPRTDVLAANGVLAKGTHLRFVIALSMSSETARVGDHIPLLLDQSVLVGTAPAVTNGSPGDAIVTRVERAGPGGKPGIIVFQVVSLDNRGVSIPLHAILTLAASDKAAKAQRLSNPNMVHVAGAVPHGDEADVLPGMLLTAVVTADTPVHP
jgi:hypothetical protein